MKNETTTTRKRGAGARPPQLVRAQLTRLRGSRSILGIPEIIALFAATLLLLTASASYLLLLRPQRTRLQAMTEERAQLQRQLKDMESNVQKNQDVQTSARGILDSLVNFEAEHLGSGGHGSTRVIEELNRLIRKNGLRISGGLAFTQLQETAPGETRQRQQRGGGEQTAARVVESVFPGVAVTLTVEGTYPKLRQFIRDVEADRQSFVVINTVELEGIADSGNISAASASSPTVSTGEENPVAAAPRPATASGARGMLVSLRLDMAAYFRRANAGALPEEGATPLEGGLK